MQKPIWNTAERLVPGTMSKQRGSLHMSLFGRALLENDLFFKFICKIVFFKLYLDQA